MKKNERYDIVAEADDFYKASNFAEYTVDKKIEGAYARSRRTAILCYVLFSAIFIGVLCALFVWMVALAPIFIWMAIYFTWPHFCVSYYYVIKDAHFTSMICHGKKKTELCRMRISECDAIAPYNQEYREQYKELLEGSQQIDIRPSADCEDAFFAICNKKTVIFKATAPAIKALGYYSNKIHKK